MLGIKEKGSYNLRKQLEFCNGHKIVRQNENLVPRNNNDGITGMLK